MVENLIYYDWFLFMPALSPRLSKVKIRIMLICVNVELIDASIKCKGVDQMDSRGNNSESLLQQEI